MTEALNFLSTVPFGDIGFGGVVILAIVLIFRGDIVPRSTFDAVIASKKEENETLKEAYRMSEQARSINTEADKELLELGRTTVHLLQSIHEKAHGADK